MANRWRWPPDSVTPRSPSTVSKPSSSSATKPEAAAASSAATSSPSPTSCPRVRLARTVSANRNVSWRTVATEPDTPSGPRVVVALPSMRTSPLVGGTSPASRETSVLLPEPVAPTRATDSAGSNRRLRSARTSIPSTWAKPTASNSTTTGRLISLARRLDPTSGSSSDWVSVGSAITPSIRSIATTDRGISWNRYPNISMGRVRMLKRDMARTTSPMVTDPPSTSQTPISSRTIIPSWGSE